MHRRYPLRMIEASAVVNGAATTDRLATATNNASLTAFGFIGWFYCTTRTDLRILISRHANGGAAGVYRLNITGTSGDLRAFWFRATTDALATTNTTPLALSSWVCIALVLDQAAAQVVRIFSGTPVTRMAECGYTTIDNGTGTFTTSEDTTTVGNGLTASSFSRAFQGSIGPCAAFMRPPVLSELIAWQQTCLDEPYPSVMAGNIGTYYPGLDGSAKVIDYSGNHNDLTITGSTVARSGLALPAYDPMWVQSRFKAPAGVASTKFLPEWLGIRSLHPVGLN